MYGRFRGDAVMTMARPGRRSIFENLRRSPGDISRGLVEFSANASIPLSEQILEEYKNKWVAIYKGSILAAADDLDQLARLVAAQHVPATETIFKHIDRKEKVFIL